MGEAEPVDESDVDGVTLGVPDADGLAVIDGVCVPVLLGEDDEDAVPDTLGVPEAVIEGVPEALCVPELLCVAVSDGVPRALGVPDGLGEPDALGVVLPLGDLLPEAVALGDGVAVWLPEPLKVRDGVPVVLGVWLRVRLGVPLLVLLPLALELILGVPLSVLLGVSVSDGVREGVGEHTDFTPTIRMPGQPRASVEKLAPELNETTGTTGWAKPATGMVLVKSDESCQSRATLDETTTRKKRDARVSTRKPTPREIGT